MAGEVESLFTNFPLSSFLPQGDTLHLPGAPVQLVGYLGSVDILLIAKM